MGKNECKVLVVDDQYDFVEEVEAASDQLNPPCEVRWASTFIEARDFLLQWEPHIVLLDVHMPPDDNVLRSFRFCSFILSHLESTVIVFISADYESDLVSTAISVGARDYIFKGDFDKDLLEKLRSEVDP
ncbi:MAG: response regulator [Anaerolineae bacterium]|nr:response regulator [Anaerolineae bacterium]